MLKDTRERFTLRLPTNLFVKLRDKANENGTSINALILQVLREWVQEQDERELADTKQCGGTEGECRNDKSRGKENRNHD